VRQVDVSYTDSSLCYAGMTTQVTVACSLKMHSHTPHVDARVEGVEPDVTARLF
jgi:hypothetical protein